MVLAMGMKGNVLDQDEISVAFDFGEDSIEHLLRVLLIAREELGISLDDPLGRIPESLAIRILTDEGQESPDGGFSLGPARARWLGCRAGAPGDECHGIHGPDL